MSGHVTSDDRDAPQHARADRPKASTAEYLTEPVVLDEPFEIVSAHTVSLRISCSHQYD
jgi:hypothetical protein